MRQRAFTGLAAAALLALAACGGDDDDDAAASSTAPGATESAGTSTATAPASAGSATHRRHLAAATPSSPARRSPPTAAPPTRRPGRSRYLSGFDFAATASIVDVVVAEQAGYYDDLCLDVELTAELLDVQLRADRRRRGRDRVGRLVQRGRRLRHGERRRARRRRRRGPRRDRQPDHQARRADDARGGRRHDDRRQGQDPRQRRGDARRRRARRGHRLPDRPARRLRPDRPLPPRRHRRLPGLQEQRAGPARAGRPAVHAVRPDGVRRARLVRRPVHDQGVGRGQPDRRLQDFLRATMQGLADALADPGGGDADRRRPRRGRTATRASCRWRASRTAGRPTPSCCRRRPPTATTACPTSPPCRRSSTPTPPSASSAAPPPTPPSSPSSTPSPASTTSDQVIWPSDGRPPRDCRSAVLRAWRRPASAERSTDHPHTRTAERSRMALAFCEIGPRAGIMLGVIEHLRAAWDELTAPGGPFAMSEIDVRGIPTRVFDSAPPTMRDDLGADAAVRRPRRTSSTRTSTTPTPRSAPRCAPSPTTSATSTASAPATASRSAMRNYPEWVVGYWAITSIGAAVVGINAWWTTPEMEYGLADSRPKVLIADDERIERVLPVLDGLRAEHAAAADRRAHRPRAARPTRARWADVVRRRRGARRRCPPPTIDPDDDATIFYTSGTTGFPKGAQLTHRGSVHNIFHLVFWATGRRAPPRPRRSPPASCRRPADPRPAPAIAVFMAPTPLFHVTACNCLLHPCTLTGGKIVLTLQVGPGPGARADRARGRHELLRRADDEPRAASPTPTGPRATRRRCAGMGGGGAPLQPDLVDKIDKSLGDGAPSTGYGLTETHGIVTANSAALLPRQAGVVRADRADARRQARRRRRRRPAARARRRRRAVRARRRRDQGLPQPARGDRRGDPRRLVPHRRHRPHRRGRLRVHRRPGQGHGAARRRERVLLRGRGGDLRARRRRRGGRVRRARRAPRRGRRAPSSCCATGATLDADELRRVPRRPHRQAQDPGHDLVPRRASCRATPTASS